MLLKVALNVTFATGDVWALLIAGSAGWGNYRHQADVLHVRFPSCWPAVNASRCAAQKHLASYR